MTTAVTTPTGSLIARLIREARQRARRRRLWVGTAALAVAAAAAVSYTQLSRGSAAVAACTTSDYRLSTGAQGATGNLIAGVDFLHRTPSTCQLTAAVTFSALGPDGSPLRIPGNPATWHASGTLSQNRDVTALWRYGPACNTPALTFVAQVAGGPTVRSTSPAIRSHCDAPGEKALVRINQP